MRKAPRRSAVRAGAVSVLGALLIAALAAGNVSAATRPITFDLYLGYGFMYGIASDSATVTLRWKDSTGHLKARAEVTSSESGHWSFDAPAATFVEVGDRLTASDGNSTHTLVVPELTAVVNRVKNVIKGTAPAGRVFLDCLYPGHPVPDIVCRTKRLAVNDEGRWRYWPGYNLQGGDGAELRWKSPEGDDITFWAQAPYVVVTLGRAGVSGVGRQNSTATVLLKEASTHERLASWSSPIGVHQSFTGTLRDSAGERVFVTPGQYVVSTIASDAAFIVPEIQATADVDTDTVSGRCWDTGRSAHGVYILVYRSGAQRGFAVTGTEEDGSFSHDMTDSFPNSSVVKHGDDVLIACVLKNHDFVRKWITVP